MSTTSFDNLHRVSSPMKHGEYTQVLRQHLPKSAFKRAPEKLINVLAHVGIYASGIWLISHYSNNLLGLLCAVVMGHSLACLGFLTHDLSHGSILAKGKYRDAVEMALFTLNAISTTMWRKTHNKLHHFHTNMMSDPDRKFTEQELNQARRLHSQVFWPNKFSGLKRPAVLLKFISYLISHTLGAITPAFWNPIFVSTKAQYSLKERRQVLFEVCIILAFWGCVFLLLDQQWLKFFWAVPVPLMVSSSVLMLYIQTNHSLTPLQSESDPVRSSVSVTVPRIMNLIHDNISYHTEHHIYPSMNPKHYPLVSTLLKTHFPERFNQITLGQAWSRLWQSDIYIEERAPNKN